VNQLCAFVLALATGAAWGQDVSYNTDTGLLTIPSVQVGALSYTNVMLLNTGNYRFALQGATAAATADVPLASYDDASGILTLPAVNVGGTLYSATLLNTGNFTFVLQSASEVQPYIYYSATSTAPRTATLDADGTLTMGPLKLTGFTFGANAADATGTLTRWAAPGLFWNQPNVPVMLFCTADNRIAYVLLQTVTSDPNRGTNTVFNLMAAIESASQYDGIDVYTDCSGTFTHSWHNDKPNSDFNYWPDIFSSYTYDTVVNQLNHAPVFFESGPAAPNKDNYLAITWPMTGAPAFEIWK
jgi:hypothetical protein